MGKAGFMKCLDVVLLLLSFASQVAIWSTTRIS